MMNITPKGSKLVLPDFGFPVHSVLVEQNGKLLQDDYFAPYGREQLHRMFSVTKSFCSLAIGALCASGTLALDDKIVSFFPEYVKEPVHPYLASMTIRNMLMMQTCYTSTTYKLDMTNDWVESFFTTAPSHRPGQVFNYDTSSSHTLAALIKKLTGKGVLDYLRTLGFDRLGLSADAYIICDPFGSEMGGSGLMARPSDLLLAMRLVMDLTTGRFFSCIEGSAEAGLSSVVHAGTDGAACCCASSDIEHAKANENTSSGETSTCACGCTSSANAEPGSPTDFTAESSADASAFPTVTADAQRALYPSLVTEAFPLSFWIRFAAYLKDAVSLQTPTALTGQTIDERQGYGYQFWMLRNGGAAMFGMGGQYAIMYPAHELLYVITADSQNIKGGTQFLLNAVNAHMKQLYAADAEHQHPSAGAEAASCDESAADGTSHGRSGYAGTTAGAKTARTHGGASANPSEAIVPYTGCYKLNDNPSGFTDFILEDGMLRLNQRWGAIEFEYEFPFGWDTPKQGCTDKYQQYVYTTGQIQCDGSLYLCAQILDEYVGSIHMQFRFTDEKVTIHMRKIEETYFKEFNGFFEGVKN